jgi:hypothetical protein
MSDIKEVKLTGEAAELLMPKTRKNRKAKMITSVTSNDSNNLVKTSNITSSPVQQGTNDINDRSIVSIPNLLTNINKEHEKISENKPSVILTRKNKINFNTNQTVNKSKVKPIIKVENKPIENKPLENKSLENKPLENKSLENKPLENKSLENKPLENKISENNVFENKPIESKTRKNKFGGRRISISLDNDPKTKKVRKTIKNKVASMSVDEIRERLAKDGLINKNNRKIPELMLRNMMKDSLLLASGK